MYHCSVGGRVIHYLPFRSRWRRRRMGDGGETMDQILSRRFRCLWSDRDKPSERQRRKVVEEEEADVNAAMEKYVYSMGEEEEEEDEDVNAAVEKYVYSEEEERKRRRRRRRSRRRRKEEATVEKYVNAMGEEEEDDDEEEETRRRRKRKRRRRREDATVEKYVKAMLQILCTIASHKKCNQKKLCEPNPMTPPQISWSCGTNSPTNAASASQKNSPSTGLSFDRLSHSSSDDDAYHQGPNPVIPPQVSFINITNAASSSQKNSPCPTYYPLSNSSSAADDDDEEEEEVEEEDSNGLFIPENFKIQVKIQVAGVKWIKHYSSNHKILLVGEGDFSFSASLAAAFGSATNITATSLDSLGFLVRNYRKALPNIIALKYHGANVLHEVDATEMADLPPFKYMRRFDRVVYNFPHAGFFRNQTREVNIMQNQTLVELFLENAKKMADISGEIHITHKCNGFFLEWDLEGVASRVGLRLKEEVHFDLSDYPGYNTKYGFGGDKNFNCNPSKTYKFVHQNPIRLKDLM